MVSDSKRKTVFVLGAGASVPYGFPDGRKLRNSIITSFRKDIAKIYAKNKQILGEQAYNGFLARVDKFIKHFDKSRTNIDFFMTRREGDYDELGKVAIFNEVLKAERVCRFRSVKVEVDWYYWLFNNYTYKGTTLNI